MKLVNKTIYLYAAVLLYSTFTCYGDDEIANHNSSIDKSVIIQSFNRTKDPSLPSISKPRKQRKLRNDRQTKALKTTKAPKSTTKEATKSPKLVWQRVYPLSILKGDGANDYFGWSIAMSSNGLRIIVGAPFNDYNGTSKRSSSRPSAGQVKVFKDNGSSWLLVNNIIHGDYAYSNFGFSVGISADGFRIIVGAPWYDTNGSDNLGQIKVFEDNGSPPWLLVNDSILGDAQYDYFGLSVGISSDGSRIIVGDRSGQVKVFDDKESSWALVHDMIISGEYAYYSNFGFSVGISADGFRIIVGAPPFHSGGTFNAGHVKVFEDNGSPPWLLVNDSILGDAEDDQFGLSVGISSDGSRIIVGAPGNDSDGDRSGKVSVFDDKESSWLLVHDIVISGDVEDDQFGKSVGISADGSRIIVGSPNDYGCGQVKVFDDYMLSWALVTTNEPIDGSIPCGEFGYSVGLGNNGKRMVIGGPKALDVGNVQVFEQRQYKEPSELYVPKSIFPLVSTMKATV